MTNNKTINLKHNELVKLISESIMEIYAKKLIKEQRQTTKTKTSSTNKATLINPNAFYVPNITSKYSGTKEEAMKGWEALTPEIRTQLEKHHIKPFMAITHTTYGKLPASVRLYIQGYLYGYNPPSEVIRNQALAAGEMLYQYIPGIRMVRIGQVNICYNLKLDKKVDCETGLAIDGTHKEVGFEVYPSTVTVPSIFAYEGGVMNTKYFCRPYLLGDKKIPEEVRPKVLGFLQKAWADKTKEDLGINKEDWYSGDKQTNSELGEKLGETLDYDILKLVSMYITKDIEEKEHKYNMGTWTYKVGSINKVDQSVRLSDEQHQSYFKEMKRFAKMLLETNCGFGVGKKAMTDAETDIRDKYGDIFAFMKEKPDNWDEMSPEAQLKWLKDNESELEVMTTEEKQDEVQFWWDMVSIVLVVAAVVVTVASAGTLAPLAAALVYASVGMGVASAVFDLYQGQYGWGVMGLTLEAVPFLKILKVSRYLKHAKISPKQMDEMLKYSLKNGKSALKAKYGLKGKALFKALGENKEAILKALDANTKEGVKFLKRFATIDPAEFYLMRQLNPAFKSATKNIPFAQFNKGIDELSSVIFANRAAWRSMLGKVKYSLGVPLKMVAASLAGIAITETVQCFDVHVNISGKGIMLDALKLQTGLAPILGLETIKWTLDPAQTMEKPMCTLLALIHQNMTGKDDREIDELEALLNQKIDGDVTIDTNGEGHTVITIDNYNEDGTLEEVTVVNLEKVVDDVTEIMTKDAVPKYKAMLEAYLLDEDILEYVLEELGDGSEEDGEVELERLLSGVQNGDENDTQKMFAVIEEASKVFIHREDEIANKRLELENKYGVQ